MMEVSKTTLRRGVSPPIVRPVASSALSSPILSQHRHRLLLRRLPGPHHLLPLRQHRHEARVGLDAGPEGLYEGTGLFVGLAVLADEEGDDDGTGAGYALGVRE
jgi:hypothetical protein